MLRFLSLLQIISSCTVLGSTASAAVIFTPSGNDLLVEIDQPLVFTVNRDASDTYFRVVFQDAFSSPNTDPAFVVGVAESTTPTTMSLNGTTNDSYRHWGHLPYSAGGYTQTDLFGSYEFNTTQILTIGDTVVVSPGVVRLPSVLLHTGGRVPDQQPMTALLADGSSLFAISDPVNLSAVPEPSSVAILATVCGGFLYRRRRKRTARQ